MELPERISILGIPYRVELGGVEPDENGSCSPSKRLISIREGLCDEERTQVLLHEVVHAVLAGLAYDDLYADERLVQGLAIGLHQALFQPTSGAQALGRGPTRRRSSTPCRCFGAVSF